MPTKVDAGRGWAGRVGLAVPLVHGRRAKRQERAMVPTKVVGRGWAGRRRGVGLAVERAMVPTKVVGRGVGSAVPQVVHGWGGGPGGGTSMPPPRG